MKPFKVAYMDGMVDIDSPDFSYSLISNMYEKNIPGSGLQINPPLNEEKVRTLCDKIAKAVLEYNTPTLGEKVADRLSGTVDARQAFPTGYVWECPYCAHSFHALNKSGTISWFCPQCSRTFHVRFPIKENSVP